MHTPSPNAGHRRSPRFAAMLEKPERGAVSAAGGASGEARSEGPDKGKRRSRDRVVVTPAMGGEVTGYRVLRERRPLPNASYEGNTNADEVWEFPPPFCSPGHFIGVCVDLRLRY